jgi:hypothetical protein
MITIPPIPAELLKFWRQAIPMCEPAVDSHIYDMQCVHCCHVAELQPPWLAAQQYLQLLQLG